MGNVVMGDLDGKTERIAFETHDIEQVITRYKANVVSGSDDQDLIMEYNSRIFPVRGPVEKEDIRPYFIILKSGIAYNANDCQMLFNVEELPDSILSGIDTSGKKFLCKKYMNGSGDINNLTAVNVPVKEDTHFTLDDTENLKDIIDKLKKGEFFELLTMEFSDKIKGIAKELIEFRRDIQTKIEPDIVEIASKDIPEASNQLEGINETLEESTMKIMDINEEQMESANSQYAILENLISKQNEGEGMSIGVSLEEAIATIEYQMAFLKEVEQRSLNMMEPLNFQDLVGQRIQRIIRLVRSMEIRIEELIVSFGIKLKKHKEDPEKSYDELNKDVDEFMYELKGPQRSGEGLDQAAIDDLLNGI